MEKRSEVFYIEKIIVDKGWPDDMEGIVEADRAGERQAQRRQKGNGILIILYEDFVQGTYNERLKST